MFLALLGIFGLLLGVFFVLCGIKRERRDHRPRWDSPTFKEIFPLNIMERQHIETFSNLADDETRLSEHFGSRLVVQRIAIDL